MNKSYRMHIWEYQEMLYQDYLYPVTHFYKKTIHEVFFQEYVPSAKL